MNYANNSFCNSNLIYIYICVWGGGGVSWTWVAMSTHLIKTQHKARDPSNELDLVHGETVSLGPFHNGPSPEFGTMAKGTTTWRTLEWSVKRWLITKVVEVKHPRTQFDVWNKFQWNPLKSWGSLGILMDIGICVWSGEIMMKTPLMRGYKKGKKVEA